MEKILNEVKAFLKALFCFAIACLLLPFLFLSFICGHYSGEFVNYILSIKYPHLTISKTKKIRSLIDTSKNAGIFHFLIQIKGNCDFEKIKKFYVEHLTDVRDKTGLRFPKLRQKLISLWGHYAWVNDASSFNINNHVLLSPSTYRGRAVTDGNIQDFVSDLVTKYIPSDLPQWQVIVIPIKHRISMADNEKEVLKDTDHYCLLIKIHHMIIAEEEDLHISEMLMLEEPDRRQPIDIDALNKITKPQSDSQFVRKPVHIQNLLQHITKFIINQWNAFIYEFESLETPDGYMPVKIINIRQLISVLIIIAVNVALDYWRMMKTREKLKRRSRNFKGTQSRWRLFTTLVLREISHRNLSWDIAYNAIRTSLQPKNMVKTFTRFIWQSNVNNFILMPYHIYCEIMAFKELVFKGQTSQMSTTYLGRLSVYVPLLIYAQVEFFKICYELFKAPVNIYEELFEHTTKESNILQLKSYCGRKIVSFSKPIDAKTLRARLNFNLQVTETDFTLSCLAGALYDYFETFAPKVPVPKLLNTTCRTIAKGYFTDRSGDKTDYIGGVVFLKLPLCIPDREHARQLHSIAEQIRRKQIMIYLASMGQTKYDLLTSLMPRVLTKICINYCSFQFPVTLTEIHGATSKFQMLWGQEVEDVLLFRPPQSKTCLSLNIHRFGDKYRLAIMADTILGMEHTKIARAFENYMENSML